MLKPRKGYGSTNTEIIKHEDDLSLLACDHVGLDKPMDMIVETFVEGEMYHVDGLCKDGEVKVCWPCKYTSPVSDFKANDYLASYALAPENDVVVRIQEFVIGCIEALGGPALFPFHGEVWITPEDEIVFCEVCCLFVWVVLSVSGYGVVLFMV